MQYSAVNFTSSAVTGLPSGPDQPWLQLPCDGMYSARCRHFQGWGSRRPGPGSGCRHGHQRQGLDHHRGRIDILGPGRDIGVQDGRRLPVKHTQFAVPATFGKGGRGQGGQGQSGQRQRRGGMSEGSWQSVSDVRETGAGPTQGAAPDQWSLLRPGTSRPTFQISVSQAFSWTPPRRIGMGRGGPAIDQRDDRIAVLGHHVVHGPAQLAALGRVDDARPAG